MSGEVSKPGIGKMIGKVVLIIFGLLVGLTVLGAIVGGDKKGSDSGEPTATGSAEAPTQAAPVQEAEEPANSLTGPQQNAARSARQYLSMTGFSRDGLIDQLSSDAGSGYAVADATAAVDSLGVDWNEQAARSAKSYLDMTGFSCKGLIGQLTSDAGSKYTESEAAYGAKQAGAC
ncbi:Ltp family lipoprotein [Sphingomonas bisphenolicum]